MNYERLKEWVRDRKTVILTTSFVGSRILNSMAAKQAKIFTNLQNAPFVDVGPALTRLMANAPPWAILPYVGIRGQPVKELVADKVQGYFISTINAFFNAFPKIGKNTKLSRGGDLMGEIPAYFGLKGTSGMIVQVTMPEDGYNLFQELRSDADGLTVLFGRVRKLTNDSYIIVPSDPYVLTESLESTLKSYKFRHSILQFTGGFFLGIGIGVSLWKLWDLWKLRKEWKRRDLIERNQQEMQRQRRMAQAQCPENAANNAANNEILATCVVCLTNPRQLIFMPCGHIVCCVNCAVRLRETCPVCKKRYTHTHAAFLS